MISQKLRNYNAARSQHLHASFAEPGDLTHLPEYEACVPASHVDSAEHCLESDVEHGSSSSGSDICCPSDVGAPSRPPKVFCKSSKSDAPPSLRCGHMPEGFIVEIFHDPPQQVHARNLEG